MPLYDLFLSKKTDMVIKTCSGTLADFLYNLQEVQYLGYGYIQGNSVITGQGYLKAHPEHKESYIEYRRKEKEARKCV